MSSSHIDDLSKALNPRGMPHTEAVATRGAGVFDSAKAICKLVLQELQKS